MQRMLVLSLLLLFRTGQTTQIPAHAKDAGPSKSFRDESMSLTFAYPATFVERDAIEAAAKKKFDATTGETKAALSCISIPMSGLERADSNLSSITIIHSNNKCQGINVKESTLREFATGMLKGISSTIKSDFDNPVSYSLAGRQAILLQGKVLPATGPETFLIEACVSVQGDFYCWQLTSLSNKRLIELASSNVTFDGSAATSIVPASLLEKL